MSEVLELRAIIKDITASATVLERENRELKEENARLAAALAGSDEEEARVATELWADRRVKL